MTGLIIRGKFLDKHTWGELEDKIWDWIEREYGLSQGMMEREYANLKVILIDDSEAEADKKRGCETVEEVKKE